ncbi:hypothetical protein AO716_06360 [Arthrobacter sp. Edens01]|nr:hypothetical protein AO716_06360 [Arthrobacter sp. Edens01]
MASRHRHPGKVLAGVRLPLLPLKNPELIDPAGSACGVRTREATMGIQPNDPMYNYNQGYPGGRRSNQGWGMALAGLILGIIALGLFWIPVINFLALVLAIIGLGLSIAGLVIAVRNQSSAKGLSIAAVIVSGIAFLLCVASTFLWSALFSAVDDDSTRRTPAPAVTVTSPATTDGTTPSVSPSAPGTGGTGTGGTGTSGAATGSAATSSPTP